MHIINETENKVNTSSVAMPVDRDYGLKIIKYLQSFYEHRNEYLENSLKAPIIRTILSGNNDPNALLKSHLKLESKAIYGLVILTIFKSNHKELLNQIVSMTPDEQASVQPDILDEIRSAYDDTKSEINLNGKSFQRYKTNLISVISNWIKDCQEHPEAMGAKYGMVFSASDERSTNNNQETTKEKKFYTLRNNKDDCKYKFDAYKSENGIIYVVVKVSDAGVEFKRIDEVGDEFKEAGVEKRRTIRMNRSQEEKRKAADSNYRGLPLNISENELKNLAELLLKSLYTYYTNPEEYLDDKETGEEYKQGLISGLMGGNYTDEKGQRVPVISSTEAFNFWYDGCWMRTTPQSNKISNRGNRYMIEAFYIISEMNNKIGAGVDSAVELANTALTDSRLADYSRIYSSVKIRIIQNHLGDIWKKASALLLKSVPRRGGDLDDAEKKMTKSSRIINIKDIVVNSTICSKVKTGHNETVFNWRVLTVDAASNSTRLELQSVFCNGYDVSKLFSKEINKTLTIDNSEILSSNFYNKKYSVGDIVESFLSKNIVIPVDLELMSFDDICEEFNDSPEKMDIINDIAHKLGFADNLDQMIIMKTDNSKYSPEYLDYMDCKQFDSYMKYELYNDQGNINIYCTVINSSLYILAKDETDLIDYLKMI